MGITYPTVTVRIELEEIPYPVWRRIEVPAKTTLDRFHQLLQAAMGWYDMHLHCFTSARTSAFTGEPIVYVTQNEIDELGQGILEDTTTVEQLLPSDGSTAYYQYDYGDGWMHLLSREASGDRTAEFEGSVFLGGLGACPPEDSGGPAGIEQMYELKQRQATDPASLTADERELLAIMGDEFDLENPQLDVRAFLVQALPTAEVLKRFGPAVQEYFANHGNPLPYDVRELAAVAARSMVDETGMRFLSADLSDELAEAIAGTIRKWLSYFEDGVKLTEAGWLPPKLVDRLIEDGLVDSLTADEDKSGRREIDEPTVQFAREYLMQLGYLRKYKGAIVVPKKIQAILDDDHALVEVSVSRMLPRGKDESLRDAWMIGTVEVASSDYPELKQFSPQLLFEGLGWTLEGNPSVFALSLMWRVAHRDAFGPTRFLLQGLTQVQAAQFGRYLLTHLE